MLIDVDRFWIYIHMELAVNIFLRSRWTRLILASRLQRFQLPLSLNLLSSSLIMASLIYGKLCRGHWILHSISHVHVFSLGNLISSFIYIFVYSTFRQKNLLRKLWIKKNCKSGIFVSALYFVPKVVSISAPLLIPNAHSDYWNNANGLIFLILGLKRT